MTIQDARTAAVLLAFREVGHHTYIWGGDSTDEGGFDCSGFVSVAVLREAARAWPELYDGQRRTADSLYRYYSGRGVPDLRFVDQLLPGTLVFYRMPGQPFHHVALHLCSVPPISVGARKALFGPLAIEAGGGGSKTTTPREALIANAQVRLTASDKHGTAEWIAKDPFTLLS